MNTAFRNTETSSGLLHLLYMISLAVASFFRKFLSFLDKFADTW